jgi:hypothetical protein
MLGLFRPLELCVCRSILISGALCLVVLLSRMVKFSSKFIYLPFVEHDISITIQILEFYCLGQEYSVLPLILVVLIWSFLVYYSKLRINWKINI